MRGYLFAFGVVALLVFGCRARDGSAVAKDGMKDKPHHEQAGRGTTPSPPGGVSKVPYAVPPLSEAEKRVILEKGTESPFTGKYWNTTDRGVYVCRQCGAYLYLSQDKFNSECGWPSFDEEVRGAVKRQTDADGRRTEIVCANCGGHLGHVFTGERLTPKDTRHCVNSISMTFVPEANWPLQKAIFAGGCFWGVEHHLARAPGVLAVRSGFTGGTVENPTYKQVCAGTTGHAEAVEVVFDPAKVSYERLARLFLDIHDPTQKNRQGPDVGVQYRSAVFYFGEAQKKTAESLIALLRLRGLDVVTEVVPASAFWPAEEYHQHYLEKHPGHPICQVYVDRFGDAATKPATR